MIETTYSKSQSEMGGVLALDVGSTTGVCYMSTSGEIEELSIIKLTSKAKGFKKLVSAYECLRKTMVLLMPSIVVIEGALTCKGKYGESAKIELHGVYKLVLQQFDFEPTIVYPSTLKKFITGNGRSSKDEVRKAVNENYPDLKFKTHDQSDAAALAIWGYQTHFLEETRQEVLWRT